ncbi:MAG: 5'-methylthioadenosine/S-adenosylhomocysteine nucleosidase [Selenomonas sp.]|uniref:5'-methylthioadenosine/S-adenosylhomocysteine nucleosidase n=1 Tax=Selenomonas sp. TaxID=2053611 RepID=UPI0025F7DE2A|nr:5'-methylthioadenosine/S-adenosylhomocysteine nucleosidase [Selenomonas sp.]MCR5439015.1 5'-methylthioadenosine/S-adenosylhomocysteine nucleosidase [Selenomonas sp.]
MDTRKIMIEGAMNMETELLLEALTDPQEQFVGQWRFVEGKYQEVNLVVAVTSIGMTNAAAATALGIEKFRPTAVISQGTAGGHDPALKAYDIVLGRRSFDASSYRSAQEDFVDWRHMELMGSYAYDEETQSFVPQAVYYPGDEKLLAAAQVVAKDYKRGRVVAGCIASCNTWNRQKARLQFSHNQFGSSCEDMEVNSAAQICQQYGIPFLGIRILSNTEFRAEEFRPESAKVCQRFVLAVAQQYDKALTGN